MAYDANDPADKKILKDAVDAALAEQQEEHETEIEGLKEKNKELLGKLSKARKGDGGEDNLAEITRLENELDESKSKLRNAESELRTANRTLATVTGERDTAVAERDKEKAFATDTVKDSALTGALIEAKVAPEFVDAAKALLSGSITVKETDGGKREAFVGDKSLGDHVKEWAGSDKGKPFVSAGNNGGGGASNFTPSGGGNKKISEMNFDERTAHYKAVGQVEFDKQVAAERSAPKS